MDIKTLESSIEQWLIEDIGNGDHTSMSTIPADASGSAMLIAKENGILAGCEVAQFIFQKVDPDLKFNSEISDGSEIKASDTILKVQGNIRSILAAERLVLNVMQRMSGIATTTAEYASLVSHTKAQLLDTRKTTPGFRILEKEAVRIGGGVNHRFGLFDMILIKDNHIDFAGGIESAIERSFNYLKEKNLHLKIEVEARTIDDVKKALLTGKVDRILLDNFTIEMTYEAVSLINGECETESSGWINKNSIKGYAECGVDYISVGALTHQIKSLDLSLKANF